MPDTAEWPVDLPSAPLWGYTEIPSEIVARSPTPAVKSRPIYTAPVFGYQFTTVLNKEQFQSFKTFWQTGIANGSLPFKWILPHDTTTEAKYLPLSNYVHSHVSAGLHRISMYLELVNDGE